MNTKRVLVVVFFIYQALVSNLWAATYYVNNQLSSASDTNAGTASAPWKSIGKANSVLTGGDTVIIRPGTYRETIRPARSGGAQAYITYTVDQSATAPVIITGVYHAVDLRGRSYIRIDGITVRETSHYWVNMRDDSISNHSHHNIIQNCDMRQTVQRSGVWAGIYIKNANYNTIKGNRFEGITGNPSGDLISVRPVCRYNLIEDNKFYYGTHQLLSFSAGAPLEYNVVRNNIFRNPYHTGMELYLSADHNLIEGNQFVDCGDEHDTNVLGSAKDQAMVRDEHKGLQIGSSELIVRKNLFVNNGRNTLVTWDDVLKKALNNRIYNNTFYMNYYGTWTNSDGGGAGTVIKNNILNNSRSYSLYQNTACSNTYVVNNNIDGTVRFGCSANYTNNLSLAPGFADPGRMDFSLQEGSGMIDDKEAFLTNTTNSGSNSTAIQVEDARFFMDGWGIIAGDRIQLQGQNQSMSILDIQGSTLTVDQPITWAKGVGVALVYNGSSPDLGAYEYGGQTEQPPPPADYNVPPPSEITSSSVVVIPAESGTLTAPMQIISSSDASTGAYVASATTGAGTASYDFNIERSGKYKIVANVYATDGGSDSFYVKIDNGGEDVWDIFQGDAAKFGVWGQDDVAYRGTGTFAAPQYDPYTVIFTEGTHTISFRARDPNAGLDYFYLVKLPDRTGVIEAENGTLTAPMQIVSSAEASGGGYIISSASDTGTAVYNFNIETAGLYKIIATAYTPDGGADSFFVKIDGGAEDIWDIFQGDPAMYGAWRQDEVSYRGTETYDMPENDPYAAELTRGSHTISFRGRESNARLDSFYLDRVTYEPAIVKLEFGK